MNTPHSEFEHISVFRASLVSIVAEVLAANPLGFSQQDIETAMGVNPSEGERRRIRGQLVRMVKAGQLDRIARGLFIAGEYTIEQNDLAGLVGAAFRDAGGVIRLDDLLANLPHALANRRKVLAYLAANDEYMTCLPIHGLTRLWLLRPELRYRLPLAGEYQFLELRLLRMTRGPLPIGWGMEELRALRRRIGQGLADARILRETDIPALLSDPALRGAMLDRIEALTAAEKPDEALAMLVSGRDGKGPSALLEALWEDLESGDSLACFQRILDVRCWDAIGAALDLDAAALSRGSFARRKTPSK